jgi:hypothetical protein
MNLYCHECNELHSFTEGQVEAIVYTLQAEAADADHRPYNDDPYDLPCLRDPLAASSDAEMYAEHTEALTTRRRELVKAQLQQNKETDPEGSNKHGGD